MGSIHTPVDASSLTRRISDLERKIATLEGARTLSAATISSGGLRIVDEGTLYVDGLAQFGGDMRVSGTLSLPAGIIDNDALANPLSFAADSADSNVFAIPRTETTVVSRTVTVPAGFTTAVVQGFGTIYAMNPTASLDYLYACVFIDWPAGSTSGRQLLTPLTANNGSGNLSVNKQAEITGLSAGQRVTVRMTVKSAFANLPSTANNGSSINLLVIWAR